MNHSSSLFISKDKKEGSASLRNARDRLLILLRIKGISRRMLQQLRKIDPHLQSIFTSSSKDIQHLFQIPEKKAIHIYRQIQHPEHILRAIEQDKHIASIMTIMDKEYPTALVHIPDPPLALFAIGDQSLLKSTMSISVIGTRKPSSEGKDKLNFIITPLIEAGYVIVSGLAYGIDRFAHERTLEYGGKTIAVLGSGFRHMYPRDHLDLCKEIARKGLVLSEYAPDVRPQKYHFPERNRIISGLTKGTLVVEAMERSGTLITVDQALEQGKEVFAIPGSPLHPQTIGCHRMIQDGAKLVISAADILEEWN